MVLPLTANNTCVPNPGGVGATTAMTQVSDGLVVEVYNFATSDCCWNFVNYYTTFSFSCNAQGTGYVKYRCGSSGAASIKASGIAVGLAALFAFLFAKSF